MTEDIKFKSLEEWRQSLIGNKYRCNNSGEILIIPDTVQERDCFYWGDHCMLDVGRMNFYSRSGGNFSLVEE